MIYIPDFPYILCCAEEAVPDCIVLCSFAEQQSVWRNPGESGERFWTRVKLGGYALSLEKSVGEQLAPVTMTCIYGKRRPSDAAIRRADELESRKMQLYGRMRDPRSRPDVRVDSAIELAALVWPQSKSR